MLNSVFNSDDFIWICSETKYNIWHLEKAFSSWVINREEHAEEYLKLITDRKNKVFKLISSR